MKTSAKLSIMFVIMAIVMAVQIRVARAVILDIPAALDGTVSNTFDQDFMTGDWMRANLGHTASSFTTDLGSLDSMRAELTVPAGKVIQVDLPAGKTGYVNFYLNYHGTLAAFNMDEDWPNQMGLLGVSGPAPTLSNSSDIYGRQNGNQVVLNAFYSFDAPFSFTGWEVDITGPFSSGGTMTYSPSQTYLTIKYAADVDGGSFVTIVPEPSSLALASLGLIVCVWHRRRR